MQLSILNLTDSPILISTTNLSPISDHQHLSIHPSESLEKEIPTAFHRRRRARIVLSAILNVDDPLWTTVVNLRSSSLSCLCGSSTWRTVNMPPECPWRLVLFRIDKATRKLVVLPRRNLSSFLSDMPDSVSLASLLLPGTHDSLALHGWPISQCQSPQTPLSIQFQCGIRVIDVRLAIVEGRLMAFHGASPQDASFTEILSAVHGFLTSEEGKRETVVMSIKQEDFATNPATEFSALVRKEMFASPLAQQEIDNSPSSSTSPSKGMLFLENRVPNLGEVRGKVVLFSRFGANGHEWEGGLQGMGIHPRVWPDSSREGFQWDCQGTTVRTHDWYSIETFLSIPEKVDLASRVLQQSPPTGKRETLNISYFSASTFPLALPPIVALGFGWPPYFGFDGVNRRLGRWLVGKLGSESSDRMTTFPSPPMTQVKSISASADSASATGTLLDDTDGITVSGDSEPRLRGWALLDFFREPESELVALLVECNWRWRKSGEEGWP